EAFCLPVSIFSRCCGYSGVRLSKKILLRASSGGSKLIASTLISAKYRSPSLGGRIWPEVVSPVRRSKRRICDGETYTSSGRGRELHSGAHRKPKPSGRHSSTPSET